MGGARRARGAARARAHGERRRASTSPSTRPRSGTSGTTSPATWPTARCHAGRAPSSRWWRRTRCSPTRDGELMIAGGNDRLFAAALRRIGAPSELVDDPRFRTQPRARRQPRRARRDPASSAALGDDAAVWHERLTAAGVPGGAGRGRRRRARAPQTQALGLLQPLASSGDPRSSPPRAAASLDASAPLHRTRRRPSGSTPAEVLGEAGYDDDTIAALAARGMISA